MRAKQIREQAQHGKYEKGLRMKQTILENAITMFAAHGYSEITMIDIANACGLSKGGLYAHYRNKRALFLDSLATAFPNLGNGPDDLRRDMPAQQQLRSYIRWLITETQSNDSGRRLFLRMLPEASEEVIRNLTEQIFREPFDDLRRTIAQVNPRIDATDAAFAIFSIALMDKELRTFYRLLTDKRTDKHTIEELTDFIMTLIATGGARS